MNTIVNIAASSIFVFLAIAGCAERKDLPPDLIDLQTADKFELISLHPVAARHSKSESLSKLDVLGVFPILGRADVTDPAMRGRIIDAFRASVAMKDIKRLACFEPRHAIRVSRDGASTDFVICFHCGVTQVKRPTGTKWIETGDVGAAVFDEALKALSLPLHHE